MCGCGGQGWGEEEAGVVDGSSLTCECSAPPHPLQVTLLAVMVTQFNMRVQRYAAQMEDVAQLGGK